MGMREGKFEGSGQAGGVYPSASGEDGGVECVALAVQGLTRCLVSGPEMADGIHHMLALIHAKSHPENLQRTRPNLWLQGKGCHN